MEKIVKSGERVTHVTLDGTECAVRFAAPYRVFAVKSDSEVTVALESGRTAGQDGVMVCPAGGSVMYPHMRSLDTVYITGNGTADVYTGNEAANPFGSIAVASSGGDTEDIFDKTNITHYYDADTVDIVSGRWVDSFGNADMTLSGGTAEDNAVKLSSGEWGEITTTEPDTIYIVLKKPVRETEAVIIGKGKTANGRNGFAVWQTADATYELSATGSPFVHAEANDSVYHVVAIARMTDVDTDGTDAAMMYVDGELIGVITGVLTGSYAGYVTVNRYFGVDGYAYGCTQDTYIRMIAVGGAQSASQIIANSRHLMRKYC